jgi:hypothetical protein
MTALGKWEVLEVNFAEGIVIGLRVYSRKVVCSSR